MTQTSQRELGESDSRIEDELEDALIGLSFNGDAWAKADEIDYGPWQNSSRGRLRRQRDPGGVAGLCPEFVATASRYAGLTSVSSDRVSAKCQSLGFDGGSAGTGRGKTPPKHRGRVK